MTRVSREKRTHFPYLDYDQGGNSVKWYPDKQGKRRKKAEGSGAVEQSEDTTGECKHRLIRVISSDVEASLSSRILNL